MVPSPHSAEVEKPPGQAQVWYVYENAVKSGVGENLGRTSLEPASEESSAMEEFILISSVDCNLLDL